MRNTGTRDADQLRTGTSPVDLVEAEDEARETDRPNASALAVERAAEIMYLLAEWGDGSVSELAEATGSTGGAGRPVVPALQRQGPRPRGAPQPEILSVLGGAEPGAVAER